MLQQSSDNIATSPKSSNKMQNLVALLGSKDAFDQAFTRSVDVSARDTNPYDNRNKGDTVFQCSRKFMIKDREYDFDEDAQIFVMEGPINKSGHHNTTECGTCKEKWKKASDL